MRRNPLFVVKDMPERRELYDVLAQLPPDEAYDVMVRLCRAERKTLLTPLRRELAERARPRLALAPALAAYDLDELAEQFVDYVLDLNLDTPFLAHRLDHEDVVANGVVDLGNVDVLDDAVRAGRGVVLLPLHIGPAYASLPVLAARWPITTMYHQLRLDELRRSFFPRVDLAGIQVPGTGLLGRCVEVLESGRVLSMFPELDPAGPNRMHVPVDFLGTTVLAPGGPVALAQRRGAQLVPYVFRRTAPARYRFEFLGRLSCGEGEQARRETTAEIFGLVERCLLAGAPGGWEMWAEFDEMLAPGARPLATAG